MAGKKMNEVTQADRDRAWPFRPEGYGPDSKLDWASGVHDGNRIIQAFRDHRIAATKAERERCAVEVDNHLFLTTVDGDEQITELVAAIRALNQEETP